MQFTLNSLAVILGVFSLASAAAVESTTYPTFRLRAWRHYRNTVWPLSLYVEVDSSGNGVINKTVNYPGFDSYIKPTSKPPSGSGRPEGDLYSNIKPGGKPYRGYLHPLGKITAPKSNAIHYQLRFSKHIPKKHGVLSTNFTEVGRHCGGNCGGLALDYDFDDVDDTYGEWYVIRQEKSKNCKKGKCNEESPVWDVRWIAPVNWAAGEVSTPPDGALSIFLWV